MTQSLWDNIVFQARLRPNAPAVVGPAGPVAFQSLVRDGDGLATELIGQGLAGADMVGLLLGSSYLHLLLMLALDRLSIASMSFASADTLPPASVVRDQFGVTAIIAAKSSPGEAPCRWLVMPEQHRPRFGAADASRLAGIDSRGDALIRVGWSSGTTGGPKGTPQSRAVLMRRFERLRLLRHFGPRTRYFAAMPFSAQPHSMLATLAAGGAVVLPQPAVDFIGLANALRVTATTVPPAMLARLVDSARASGRRLETIAQLDVAGAHLPSELARDARQTLTPNLWISYGTSETGRIATADAAVCIADPTAVGYVSPWGEAEIVDDAGRTLPAGQEGFLRVRTDEMSDGYYRNPVASARNFRDGWFYPGDVASLTADGLLRVSARVEDVIRQDGAVASPLPLEEAIRTLPGVRDVAVFPLVGPGGSERICAALVLESGAETTAIHAAMRARLGDRAPAQLFQVEALPRSETGKVLRRELVQWALRSLGP